MCARWFGWVLAVAMAGVAANGHAQERKTATAPAAHKFAIPGSTESASSGRKLAADASAAKGRKNAAHSKPAADAAVATFPGFRLLPDGATRVYVELTKAVTVEERRAEGALVYTLRGARVLSRNNKNALITTHFATPVARARLLTAGGDLELVIDLRKAVNATQRVVPAENGAARLEIDFPAGDYPPVPALFGPPKGAAERAEAEARAGESESENAGAPAAATPRPAPPAEKPAAGPPSP